MKPNDTNQGEGNRDADRQYRTDVRDFISSGKVDEAAKEAKEFVETNPAEAAAAEKAATHAPTTTVDALLAKGRDVLERVKHAASDLKDKLANKSAK